MQLRQDALRALKELQGQGQRALGRCVQVDQGSRKSFRRARNSKMATMARAGIESGRITR